MAPKTGSLTSTSLAKKFLPKRRPEVLRFGACFAFFFVSLFAGAVVPFSQRSNRGNLTIDKAFGGLFVLFLFCFPIRQALTACGPFTVKCAWPNPAMPAAQLFYLPLHSSMASLRGLLPFLVR